MNQIVSGLHQGRLPRIPSKTTVTKIIHDRFGLSYRAFNSAKLRMYQAKFNEKRVWICRLLAQALSEDFLVVSIDESSFSTSQLARMKWQPKHSSEAELEQRHRERRVRDRVTAPASDPVFMSGAEPGSPHDQSPSAHA